MADFAHWNLARWPHIYIAKAKISHFIGSGVRWVRIRRHISDWKSLYLHIYLSALSIMYIGLLVDNWLNWSRAYRLLDWCRRVSHTPSLSDTPPQTMFNGGYYVFTRPISRCPDVCPVVPSDMESSAGRASPLRTCSSAGILWPHAVLSSLVIFSHKPRRPKSIKLFTTNEHGFR